MDASLVVQNERQDAFTLVEVVVALTAGVFGILAVCGLLLITSQQRSVDEQRFLVLQSARNLVADIRSTDPAAIVDQFNGISFPVPTISGNYANNNTLQTDLLPAVGLPSILEVTVTGRWNSGGREEVVQLYTEVFSATGF